MFDMAVVTTVEARLVEVDMHASHHMAVVDDLQRKETLEVEVKMRPAVQMVTEQS